MKKKEDRFVEKVLIWIGIRKTIIASLIVVPFLYLGLHYYSDGDFSLGLYIVTCLYCGGALPMCIGLYLLNVKAASKLRDERLVSSFLSVEHACDAWKNHCLDCSVLFHLMRALSELCLTEYRHSSFAPVINQMFLQEGILNGRMRESKKIFLANIPDVLHRVVESRLDSEYRRIRRQEMRRTLDDVRPNANLA